MQTNHTKSSVTEAQTKWIVSFEPESDADREYNDEYSVTYEEQWRTGTYIFAHVWDATESDRNSPPLL